MHRDWKFYSQLGLTIVLCLFIVVPVVMSALAGVTVNVFQGLSSGFTLRWIIEVLDLYTGSILLSLWIALVCLAVTLVVGVPLAYVLVRRPGGDTGFGAGVGAFDYLWRGEWLSVELAFYSDRACVVYIAFHGAIRCGGHVGDGYEDA